MIQVEKLRPARNCSRHAADSDTHHVIRGTQALSSGHSVTFTEFSVTVTEVASEIDDGSAQDFAAMPQIDLDSNQVNRWE